MFFLDYVYYLCCRYYEKNKGERASDSWRGSGLILSAVFGNSLLLGISFITKEVFGFGHENKTSVLIVSGVIFLLYLLRYNKFTNYYEIKDRVLTLSEKKRRRYNIAAVIFMFIALPGMLLLAIFLGPTFK